MITREYFEDRKNKLFKTLEKNEHVFLSLRGESSQFVRVSGAKIRQIGTVDDASVEIAFVHEDSSQSLRRATRTITLSGLSWHDDEKLKSNLDILKKEVPELPVDPYAEKPIDRGSDSKQTEGRLLPVENASELILPQKIRTLDIAGIYSSGPCVRALANSAGQSLWFSTEVFSFDFSIYTSTQRAVKKTYAGNRWDQKKFENDIEEAQRLLPYLESPAKKINRGEYRTYLAPAAVASLIEMMSWDCVGEASIRQGGSPLRHVRSGEKKFSPMFSLSENFSHGLVPRFNPLGEVAPEILPIFESGNFKNSLVSSRSSKEYKIPSNGASPADGMTAAESMRAPTVQPGLLTGSLKELDTGVYLSNLHYLNWSDQPGGRITGMTRYACFWVENGKIVSPIENMRWDESLFSFFGDALLGFTQSSEYIPDVHSFERRALGGVHAPGALLSKMNFTL